MVTVMQKNTSMSLLATHSFGSWAPAIGVPPQFCKARSLPSSMVPLVEKELDRLVVEGII